MHLQRLWSAGTVIRCTTCAIPLIGNTLLERGIVTTPPPAGQHQDPAQHTWTWLAAAPLAAAAWACCQQPTAWADADVQQSSSPSASWTARLGNLLPLQMKQRVFFTYEKRIRDLSDLHKVFTYFSSQEQNRHRYMLPEDMLHAIVPTYPPSWSTEERAGALAGERRVHHQAAKERNDKFFQQFDLDENGLMDYSEFRLVVTLLSIPPGDVQIIFDVVDLDRNGVGQCTWKLLAQQKDIAARVSTRKLCIVAGFIDAQEFQAVMQMLAGQIGMKRHHAVTQASNAALPPSGLLINFFGPKMSGKLNLKQFREFLTLLQDELVKLEFHHYLPIGQNHIPGIDFARSLVVAAEMSTVDDHLNQVDRCAQQLSSMSISFEEFESVARMQQDLHALKVALEFMAKLGRPVGKDELENLVQRFCGIKLSSQVLDVILLVFGTQPSGAEALQLDHASFLEAMRRKGSFWARRG